MLAVFLCLILSSCKKEEQYEFTVTNNTKYRIDKMEFGCAIENKDFSIEPNSISSTFNLKYTKSAGRFFTEPLVCTTILTYSDSSKSYENTLGQTFSISRLSSSSNSFKINLDLNPDPNSPTDIFTVTLN